MQSEKQIIDTVIAVIHDEIGEFEDILITADTSLTYDLKIDGDDLSFLFVPAIEKRLGKKLTNDQWSKVHTVGQIANAFWRSGRHSADS